MNDLSTTTSAPLTRRQAREIERRTGERPVAASSLPVGSAVIAADEQTIAADVHERLRRATETARIRIAEQSSRETAAPVGEPVTVFDSAVEAAQEEPAVATTAQPVVPVAFTGRDDAGSIRAPRPRNRDRVRSRRRAMGAGIAVAASAAALATAGVMAPGAISANGTQANLLTADQSLDGAAAETATDTASAVEAVEAPATDLVPAPEAVFDEAELGVTMYGPSEVDAASEPAVTKPLFVTPIPGGQMNEGYGTRGGGHNGLDIVIPGGGTCGTTLQAVGSGTITFAGPQGGYGNHVELTLDDGTMVSYSHLQDGGIAVSVGQKLNAGDVIGAAGTTGNSTGCHLHFEVTPAGGGGFTDPVPWLAERGIEI